MSTHSHHVGEEEEEEEVEVAEASVKEISEWEDGEGRGCTYARCCLLSSFSSHETGITSLPPPTFFSQSPSSNCTFICLLRTSPIFYPFIILRGGVREERKLQLFFPPPTTKFRSVISGSFLLPLVIY